MLQTPAVQGEDAFFEVPVTLRLGRQRLEFLDQTEHMAGATMNVLIHISGWIEREILRQIADHEVSAAGESAGVGLLLTRKDAQEGGFSRAVAPDHANAVAFANRKARFVE